MSVMYMCNHTHALCELLNAKLNHARKKEEKEKMEEDKKINTYLAVMLVSVTNSTNS